MTAQDISDNRIRADDVEFLEDFLSELADQLQLDQRVTGAPAQHQEKSGPSDAVRPIDTRVL